MSGGRKCSTFIWDGSDSEGTSPPLFWEILDSALRMSSRIVWKVESDMLMKVVVEGGGLLKSQIRIYDEMLTCGKWINVIYA